MLARTLAAGLWIAAALALELSEVGRATPAIPIAVMVRYRSHVIGHHSLIHTNGYPGYLAS